MPNLSSKRCVRKKLRMEPRREKAKVSPKAKASSFPLNQKAVMRFWTTPGGERISSRDPARSRSRLTRRLRPVDGQTLTGQRSVAGSEEESSRQHEGQQVGSSFEVGAQGEQGRAQNAQGGEQEDADCGETDAKVHKLGLGLNGRRHARWVPMPLDHFMIMRMI